jgi:phage terminase large subunit
MITLLPKQIECLRSLAVDSSSELVLFGGAAGGSKSFTGCLWQLQRRLKYPGTRGLIGRSQLDALKKTTLKTFFEVAAMHGLKAELNYRYLPNSKMITFPNGSEIILKDLFAYPSDPSFDSLGSLEITDFFVDEASQVSKKAIDILRSRVRFKLRELNLPPKGLLTCNPSKGWLFNEFFHPYSEGSLPDHLAFIQSRAGDNPFLPESYVRTLALLPEQDRKRLLDGDWLYDESIDKLFSQENLIRCFRSESLQGETFISADVARLGKDRTIICVWRSLQLLEIHEFRKMRIPEITDKILNLQRIHAVRSSNIIIDEDGVGGGAVDAVRGCRGFLNGSRATKPERYSNLKSECYFKLAELIEDQRIIFPSSHRDIIMRELDMIRRKNPDQDQRLAVIGKEEISRMHGISPDFADAIMMRCFAELRPNLGKYSYI